MKKLSIVCFGEVLWDLFPNYRKIGGAPLNVALRLASLGNNTYMISRVGDDDLGTQLLQYISSKGVAIDHIQIDNKNETGTVQVMLDNKGVASYSISHPVAWDYIDFSLAMKQLISKADALIYGSLSSRNRHSYETLLTLLKSARYRVFDVNLRKPHYGIEHVLRLMKEANFIKFNEEELLELGTELGATHHTLETTVEFISKLTNTDHICVTRGKDGAVLLYNNKWYYNKGYTIDVVDTVGAGDSFLAALVDQLLTKHDCQKALDFACAVGAVVAASKGANPVITVETINKFINSK